MDFVGTKKKAREVPFLCSYCGKPCDDRYCSTHCESEDKRLATLTKPKSYSEHLAAKGIKLKKIPTFELKDRIGG